MTSGVATAVDYVLYMVMVTWFFEPVLSNIISFTLAVIVNFALQKRFVFEMNRRPSRVFVLAMMVSLGGLLLSTAIIYGLNLIEFFAERQYLCKLGATGIVFFYNFYLKRFAFEKRFI